MGWFGIVGALGASLIIIGCVPSLVLPPGTLIACGSDDDCPADQTCSYDDFCVEGLEEDDVGPTLDRVLAESAVSIVAQFNEDIAEVTAMVAGNYTFAPYLEVTGAVRSSEAKHEVRLSIAPEQQIQDQTYSLTIINVRDLAGNPIPLGGDDNRQSFTGVGRVVDRSPPIPASPAPYAASPGSEEPLLSWSQPAGSETFSVEVATAADFADDDSDGVVDSLVTSAATTDNRFRVTVPLAPGTYYWRVRADVTDEDLYGVSVFDKVDQIFHVYCPTGESCEGPTLSSPPDDPDAMPVVTNPETGSTTHPYRSIARAMTAVGVLAGGPHYDAGGFRPEIRVARRGGITPYVERLSLVPGVSLRGGYGFDADPEAWQRFPGQRTFVESESLVLIAAGIRSDATLTDNTETLVEGMSFASQWSGQPMDPAPAVSTTVSIAESSAYLRLHDTEITAWAEERSVALSVANSGPDSTATTGPVVEQCEIRANTSPDDNGNADGTAIGIQIFGSAIALRNNLIIAGETGAMTAVGIDAVVGLSCADDPAAPDQCPWEDNTITAGLAYRSYGVRIVGTRYEPAVTIVRNHIRSVGSQDLLGVSGRPVSIGLALVDGCVREISSNQISGGAEADRGHVGPSTSSGLRVGGACPDYGSPTASGVFFQPITNNVITSVGGDALAMSGAIANLVHNTLVVIADPHLSPTTERIQAAIYLATAAPIVTNNILARVGGVGTNASFFGVREENACGNVSSFANNAFVDITLLHRTTHTGTDGFPESEDITIPNSLDGELTCGIFVDMDAPSAAFLTPYENNFISPDGIATSFVDADGLDDDATTAADNDYHLAVIAAAALANQGKDTALADCGHCWGWCATFPPKESCGDVTHDKDGLLRTLPVSVGAYEKD